MIIKNCTQGYDSSLLFFSLMLHERKYPLGGSVVLISSLLLLEVLSFSGSLTSVSYNVQFLGFQI